jgi:hypothetical protein
MKAIRPLLVLNGANDDWTELIFANLHQLMRGLTPASRACTSNHLLSTSRLIM